MTTVIYNQDGSEYTIQCIGHATGSDNVCAAVSSIIYTLAGYLHNTNEIVVLTSHLESGNVMLAFAGEKEAKVAFDMAVIGLLQLAKSFPEYVRIKK